MKRLGFIGYGPAQRNYDESLFPVSPPTLRLLPSQTQTGKH